MNKDEIELTPVMLRAAATAAETYDTSICNCAANWQTSPKPGDG